MREVELDRVETGLVGHARAAREIARHLVHVGAAHRLRHLAALAERDRRRSDDFPRLVRAERAAAFPWRSGRGLSPGMSELHADPGIGMGVNEFGNPAPRRDIVPACTFRRRARDPTLGRDVGHLREHQPRPAHRAAAEMDQVEVVHGAVDGRVHAHRRDDHAVDQRHPAQPERGEDRRGAAARVVRHSRIPRAFRRGGFPRWSSGAGAGARSRGNRSAHG